MSAAIQDTSAHRPAPLPWLTALRYPAAVWVVALHCWLKVGSMADISRIVHTPVGMFVDRGYLGVSFFFMLSGFILVWNYPVISSIKGYLTARAARILPVYYLALLFSLPVLIVTIRGEGFHLFQVIKGLMVLTLTQSWYPKIAGFWNGPGWTLSCEAFFYCSLPWLLPLVTRHFSGKSLKRVAAWLVLLWLAGLVAPSLFFVKYGGAVNYSTWWAATQGDPALGTGMQMKHIVENFPLLRVVEFIAGTILCAGLKPHLGAAHSAGQFSFWPQGRAGSALRSSCPSSFPWAPGACRDLPVSLRVRPCCPRQRLATLPLEPPCCWGTRVMPSIFFTCRSSRTSSCCARPGFAGAFSRRCNSCFCSLRSLFC